MPPAPYRSTTGPGGFFFGTEKLWTQLHADGVWRGLKTEWGYRDNMAWYSSDFEWRKEGDSPLTINGRRLDAPAPALLGQGHNAFTWMSVAFDIPTPGCWEITGRHKDRELAFVVWVAK